MAVQFLVQVFKIIVVHSFVFVLLVGYASSAEQITTCDPNRVAACVGDLRKMASGNSLKDFEVVEDVAGLEQKCREMEEVKSCLLRETSFCPDQIRSIYLDYMRPVTASFQDLCSPGEARDEYLKHSPCFVRMLRRNGPCGGKYEQLTKLMSTDMDFTQHNSTLPQFCCHFYAFYNCYRRETEKQCGPDAYRLFERYTGYLSSSQFTSSCEKHLNHTSCKPVASSTTGGASTASPPRSVLALLGLFAVTVLLLRRDTS